MLLSTFTCVPHLLSFAFFVRLFGSLLFICDNYVLVNYFNFLMSSFSQLLSQCYLITDFFKHFTIKWKEETVLKCSLLPTEYFWVRAPDISSSMLSIWDIFSISCHYAGHFQFSNQSKNRHSLSNFFFEHSTYYNSGWKKNNCTRPRAMANLGITVTASGSLPWIWSASVKVHEVECQKSHRNRSLYTLPGKNSVLVFRC